MAFGERQWQNRWDVEADDITTVLGMFDAFHDFHLGVLLNIFTLVKILARPAGTPDAFYETVYGEPGGRALGGAELLPLFNTVRVLLNTAAGGRPGQKFLRGILKEGDIDSSANIVPATGAFVNTAVLGLIAAVEALTGHIVLTNDKEVVNSSVQTPVQMRQLHRKRKKTA